MIICVPAGSRAAYAAADYWKEFGSIIEMGDANHDQTVSITDVGLVIDAILSQGSAAGVKKRIVDMREPQ